MQFDFNKYAQEGNEFINKLSRELGHPDEQNRVMHALRATLHSVRDRIPTGEAFHFMAQLPFFLKAVYVDQWQHGRELKRVRDLEEFRSWFEAEQARYGEDQFDWKMSTEELFNRTFQVLTEEYFSDGQADHVIKNFPAELRETLFSEA